MQVNPKYSVGFASWLLPSCLKPAWQLVWGKGTCQGPLQSQTWCIENRHTPHRTCWVCVSHSGMSTLCDPMGSSPPGSSDHGTSQARILEWVAISFSRGTSQPRDWTQVSCIAGEFFTTWATRETSILQMFLKRKMFKLKPRSLEKKIF